MDDVGSRLHHTRHRTGETRHRTGHTRESVGELVEALRWLVGTSGGVYEIRLLSVRSARWGFVAPWILRL